MSHRGNVVAFGRDPETGDSSPRLKDGFTAVPNELLEALTVGELSKREVKIVLAVIRMTLGFHKKVDAISHWQISKMTGIPRQHVSKAVAGLINKGVLFIGDGFRKSHGREVHEIGVNNRPLEWARPIQKQEPLLKQDRSQNGTQTVSNLGRQPYPNQDIQKKEKKPKRNRSTADHFDQFWSLWPKKVAKQEGLKAWKATGADQHAKAIIEDVRWRTANDPQWRDRQFIPNPATYLRGQRWTDERPDPLNGDRRANEPGLPVLGSHEWVDEP